jgi:hypothetical protein
MPFATTLWSTRSLSTHSMVWPAWIVTRLGANFRPYMTTVALGFGAGVALDDAAAPESEEPQPPASTVAASNAAVAARGTARG